MPVSSYLSLREDDEAPCLQLKNAPTALKKLGRVDTSTFSTESARSGHEDELATDRQHSHHRSSVSNFAQTSPSERTYPLPFLWKSLTLS
jgi:hypothetical protein